MKETKLSEEELKELIEKSNQLRRDSRDECHEIRTKVLMIIIANPEEYSDSFKGTVYFRYADTCLDNEERLKYLSLSEQIRENIVENTKGDQLVQAKKDLLHTYNALGIYYKYKKDTENSIAYYSKAKKIADETKDKEGSANTLNSLGKLYEEEGLFEEALRFHNESLKLRTEIYEEALKKSDTKTSDRISQYISFSHSNIGGCYINLGNYKDAMPHVIKDFDYCTNLFKENDYHSDYCPTFRNLALCIMFTSKADIDSQSLNNLEELICRISETKIDVLQNSNNLEFAKIIIESALIIASKHNETPNIKRYKDQLEKTLKLIEDEKKRSLINLS